MLLVWSKGSYKMIASVCMVMPGSCLDAVIVNIKCLAGGSGKKVDLLIQGPQKVHRLCSTQQQLSLGSFPDL